MKASIQAAASSDLSAFLVCGLGSLGQQCVFLLKEFGVIVNAIDAVEHQYWEISGLPDLLNHQLIGDCRQPEVLRQADVEQCRAVLLVTSNERVNIETAFAVRALNPHARLVVRSSQDTLNDLLSEHLGNFVAFEATQLPATAFALAALGGEIRGLFTLENQLLRVVRIQIGEHHRWRNRQLHELNSMNRRVLSYAPDVATAVKGFYQWEPDTRLQTGETIACVEIAEGNLAASPQSRSSTRQAGPRVIRELAWSKLKLRSQQVWRAIRQNQTQQVAALSGGVMLTLFLFGTVLYKLQYPDLSLQNALNVVLVLAIGGYDNLFGELKLSFPIPWWLHLYSLSLTIAGTVLIGILYALLTEQVLSARFQFLRRRPPVPRQDHIVLVGLGRVGQRVAKLLQDLKQPVVGITSNTLEPGVLPQMPVVVGNLVESLAKVHLATAKSVVMATDDEVVNLEIGLRVRPINPSANLVIRTFGPLFSQNVARLLPYARVLQSYALAAEAFAGAAFGENILDLFRLSNQTILVTEYRIETGDTMDGLLLAEIAYGYGVVPLLHQRASYEAAKLMPSDDIRLYEGDRLVVLATIEDLQRVERGETAPRGWLVRIEKAMHENAIFEGGKEIARISGCDISSARALMDQLPGTLACPLYKHQALRLVRELRKVQVSARLIPDPVLPER